MHLDVTVVVSVGEEEALGDIWGDKDPLDLGESPLLLQLQGSLNARDHLPGSMFARGIVPRGHYYQLYCS